MNNEVAEKISILMMQINAQLNDSIALVRDNCTQEEFDSYRRGAAKVMAEILLKIVNPLYSENPALMPEALDGTYKVNPKIFEPRFYEW